MNRVSQAPTEQIPPYCSYVWFRTAFWTMSQKGKTSKVMRLLFTTRYSIWSWELMVFRRPEAPTITVHDITVWIYPFEYFEEGCFTGVGRDLALLQ